MKKYLYIITLLLLMVGCASPYRATVLQGPSLQYMGNQYDGSITVRVSAHGRDYFDAMEKAKRFALREMLLRGIPVNGNPLLSKPLLSGANAEEEYQDFLDAFFSDGGRYQAFVNSKDRRRGSDQKAKAKIAVRVNTTLRLLRPQLRQYLIENNLIER